MPKKKPPAPEQVLPDPDEPEVENGTVPLQSMTGCESIGVPGADGKVTTYRPDAAGLIHASEEHVAALLQAGCTRV